MKGLDTIKKWVAAITELGLLLIALAIVVGILFGSSAPFLGGAIIDNLLGIISSLGNNGLVGLIALAVILWLFSNRKVA